MAPVSVGGQRWDNDRVSILLAIAVFGVVGAVLSTALLGLVVIVTRRSDGAASRVGLGATALAMLVVVPTLAALSVLQGRDGAGFGVAFGTAFGVVAVMAVVNVVVVPLLTRRVAATGDGRLLDHVRRSPAVMVGGGLTCALMGLVTAGLAVAVS